VTCAVIECSRAAKARGWCNRHYMRWRHHGDPLKTLHRPAEVPIGGHNAPDFLNQRLTRYLLTLSEDELRAHVQGVLDERMGRTAGRRAA
jgi:hypothetical protein